MFSQNLAHCGSSPGAIYLISFRQNTQYVKKQTMFGIFMTNSLTEYADYILQKEQCTHLL